MRIGIIGSRGIPNKYGGFEEFAENLSVGLVKAGFDVTVYSSHNHPYQGIDFQGVKIIKCYDPEDKMGVSGQFIYDMNCILDSRKRSFDIIYQLGYTSNGIWQWLLPKAQVSVINMDGMEWKRSKYGLVVRKFLKFSEKLAAKKNTLLIADSPVIRDYLKDKYNKPVQYISYGARIPEEINTSSLVELGLEERGYYLIIARLQIDNHVEEIIKGVVESKTNHPLVIVGNYKTKYGAYLRNKYNDPLIMFLGGIFNTATLNALRKYARVYFHGHSAGGTNPSLLEAMAAGAKVCAHDNAFNKAVLENNATYFRNKDHISALLDRGNIDGYNWATWKKNNLEKIKSAYNWDLIIKDYKLLFQKLIKEY